MDDPGSEVIRRATDAVAAQLGSLRPRVAIVLGSGLSSLADAVQSAIRIPQSAIPGFPEPGVAGHKGELVAGTLDGVPVVVQSGRFHLYEGHPPDVAALPARVFHALGVATLILTNAAGGIRPTFRPGTLMLIADHINLMWKNPLIGPVAPGDQRFPDMSDPYDGGLRTIARAVARDARIPLEEGVYAGLLGPSYETPAEVRRRGQRPRYEVEPIGHGLLERPAVREPGRDRGRERASGAVGGGRVEPGAGEATYGAVPHQDVDDFVSLQVAAFHERGLRPEREQRATCALHRRGRAHRLAHEDARFVEVGRDERRERHEAPGDELLRSAVQQPVAGRRHHHGIEDVVGQPPPGDALRDRCDELRRTEHPRLH